MERSNPLYESHESTGTPVRSQRRLWSGDGLAAPTRRDRVPAESSERSALAEIVRRIVAAKSRRGDVANPG